MCRLQRSHHPIIISKHKLSALDSHSGSASKTQATNTHAPVPSVKAPCRIFVLLQIAPLSTIYYIVNIVYICVYIYMYIFIESLNILFC